MKLTLENDILRSTLGKRLVFSFLVTGFIPLFIFVLFMHIYIRNILVSKTNKELIKYCNISGQRIFETLSKGRNEIQMLARSELALLSSSRTLKRLAEEQTSFEWIAFLDSRGRLLQSSMESIRVPPLSNEKLNMLTQGATVASEPYIPKGRQWPGICLYTPVYHRDKPNRIMAAEFKKEALWEVTRNLYYLDNANIYVIDKSGRVLATSSEIKAFTLLLSSRDSRRHFNKTSGTTILPHFHSGKVLAGYYTVFLEGAFHMDNWKIVIVKDYGKAVDVLQIVRQWFLLILTLSLCLLIIIGFRNIRRILTPVETLTAGVKKISGGEMNTRVHVETGDEIEQLADFFNTMTGALSKSREEIIASDEYKENIIRSMTDTLLVTDAGGVIKTVNQALLNMLGYVQEQLAGRHINEIFGMDEELFQKVYFDMDGMREYDSFYYSKQGERIPVSLSTAFMKNAQKERIGMVIAARDMRESKLLKKMNEAYADLQAAQEQLVQSEKLSLLGQLSVGLAHELRNPLGIIRTAVYNLKTSQTSCTEDLSGQIEIIDSEIHRMNKVITSILEFSKGRADTGNKADVPEILDDCIKSLETDGWLQNIRVQRNYDTVPPLTLDPSRLKLAFLNILLNAAQAIDNHGGDISVSVTLGGPFLLQVTISDTGRGISAEHFPKIFEPFFTTKDKSKGIGIGLALTRIIIEAKGGHIDVKSKPRKGTTFVITLPVERTSPG